MTTDSSPVLEREHLDVVLVGQVNTTSVVNTDSGSSPARLSDCQIGPSVATDAGSSLLVSGSP